MGCGEQGEPAGKSGITLDQRTGGVVSCFSSSTFPNALALDLSCPVISFISVPLK